MLVRAQFSAELLGGAELPGDLPARLAECNLQQLQTLQIAVTTCAQLAAWLALLPP